jgi:hypothetical protein
VAVLLPPVVLFKSAPGADRGTVAAGGVKKEGRFSIGCIVGTSGVTQKRCCTDRGVLFSGVCKKRPGADTSVELARCIAQERIQANSRIVQTCRKV